jgi:hypothetical protein
VCPIKCLEDGGPRGLCIAWKQWSQQYVPRSRGGLQVNPLDRAAAEALMTRSEMRRVIWVLDDLVDQTKLPFASDIEAWNVLLLQATP